MLLIIDRFEGDYAVCEDENKSTVNIERDRLPTAAKEGDVLKVDGNNIMIHDRETITRKQKINKMMDDLWQ